MKTLHSLHFVRQDGQDGKERKENHTTKVTKIQKYGMNEKFIVQVTILPIPTPCIAQNSLTRISITQGLKTV